MLGIPCRVAGCPSLSQEPPESTALNDGCIILGSFVLLTVPFCIFSLSLSSPSLFRLGVFLPVGRVPSKAEELRLSA